MKLTEISKCTACQSDDLHLGLSLGKQPPSNRFKKKKSDEIAENDLCRLSLGHCEQCGTIQLVERMSLETIRPRYDWLVYNEPEAHLDNLVDKIKALSNIGASSRFLGVTYKDQSTLDRIRRVGFSNTACINENDLHCLEQPFGLETIQDILSSNSTITRLRKTYGYADVLIARHILEHAFDARGFILSLRELLVPDGYMVLELPDSEQILKAGYHAFIWEEHISYFTDTSLRALSNSVGAQLIGLMRYPYPFEDSLVALLRFSKDEILASNESLKVSEGSAIVLAEFSKKFDACREKWRAEIKTYQSEGKKVAMFGAGHLTAKFINFYNLADLIDCVIDDHPEKIGMIMPGSDLKVVSSLELSARDIQVCISTLNPESETKVRDKLANFFDSGGRFIPAFSLI